MLASVSVSILISISLVVCSSDTVLNSEYHDSVYAKCEPSRNSCRDCYLALVKSLLGSADNVFSLASAFSPPSQYQPEHVIVTYTFQNETLHRDKTWFWSKSTAYYLFPMDVLQKLSFYLSKNQDLYQQHVIVTLNATDCWGVSNDYMMLLTQRVSP